MIDHLGVLAYPAAMATLPYLLPIVGRHRWWTLPPLLFLAATLFVVLAAMQFDWIDRGEKGLAMLTVLFLLWAILVGLAVRGLLAWMDRSGKSIRERFAAGAAGWIVAAWFPSAYLF